MPSFECDASSLQKAVTLASKASPTRSVLSALQNLRLLVEECGTLKITGTTLDIGLTLQVPVTVTEYDPECPGVLIPARLLKDALKPLKGTLCLSIVRNGDLYSLKIQEKQGGDETFVDSLELRLRGESIDEFPTVPHTPEEIIWRDKQLEADGVISFSPAELVRCVGEVAPFVAKDESRPLLTHILLDGRWESYGSEAGTMTLLGCDGFRAAIRQMRYTVCHRMTDPRLPRLAVPLSALTTFAQVYRQLKRAAWDDAESDEVQLHYFPPTDANDPRLRKLLLVWRDVSLMCATDHGHYPEAQKLIPTSKTLDFTLPIAPFQRVLELLSVVARDAANGVRFDVDSEKKEVTLSAESDMVGASRAVLPCDVTVYSPRQLKSATPFVLNASFILDALRSMRNHLQVKVTVADNRTGIKFEPVDSEGLNLNLLMPMHIAEWGR